MSEQLKELVLQLAGENRSLASRLNALESQRGAITRVEMQGRDLIVWIDGVRTNAGSIMPVIDLAGSRSSSGDASLISHTTGGFFDYGDLATQTTPIAVPADTWVFIPNDGQAAFSNYDYKPPGINDLWNTTTNEFDWSGLNLGDQVDIRLTLEATTTSPNQGFTVELAMAIGSAAPYFITFIGQSVKTVGTIQGIRYSGIYMGNVETLNFPAKFRIMSDDPFTYRVGGWYLRVLRLVT